MASLAMAPKRKILLSVKDWSSEVSQEMRFVNCFSSCSSLANVPNC